MKAEDKIREVYGDDPGFRVPDDYFETCFRQISENLPPYPESPRQVKLTAWQRLRPYIYMAAMFAGIWLMMKVFYTASSQPQLSLDNPPLEIAQAMISYESDAILPGDDETMSDMELMEDVGSQYDNIEDFEADFNYDLKPQYENINVDNYVE